MIYKTPCKIVSIDDNRGFTLIEVLIAIAIFAIGFLAVGLMQVNALNSTNSARRTTEAMTLAEDQAELLLAMPFYEDDNGVNDDGIGGVDDYDVLPDLQDTGAEHVAPADATLFTVRWMVTDDAPIPAYDPGMYTAGWLTRSKTIRVWVTPDNDPNDVQAEVWFAKFSRMD
ncbi:MAG: prepilin-type N-terminal cleavage/methylation domain-containing protein [Desulfobacteraceae bacterium]|nr:prepilin-type N-terminal cleavage/methylation domain-containing protein [Desulfobacteraceae bacterium]MBC2754531.1 prepilin-type N-terminal cleavage/methylation domain-containing protein [Desulfobacteraceae bacterium]MBC2763804.1 prepilin-type N-terminal cleavage/methylation domain-containing protein [ANME-2 cluster archaeon]